MKDDTKNRRALWTRADGTTTEGPADEMMRQYYASGCDGSLQPIEPGQSQLDALTLPESTWDDDEVTEAGAPLRPLAVVKAEPAAEVGQREPVAVTIASLDALAERRASGGSGFEQTAVHEEDEATAKADEDMLRRMGLEPARAFYAPGTLLNTYGLEKWKAERQALTDSKPWRELCGSVASEVRQEERRDVTVQRPASLELVNDGGRLVMSEKLPGSLGYRDIGTLERSALHALAVRYGLRRHGDDMDSPILPARSFMDTMSADQLATLWNMRAPSVLRGRSSVVLRTRRGVDASRSVFAAVSESYGVCDIDRVAQLLADELPADMRGSMVYNPNTVELDFEAVSMRDQPPTVGEVWKVGLSGGTGDAAQRKYNSRGGFWRVLCRNLTTEQLDLDGGNRIHRGDADAVAADVARLIREQWAAVGPAFAQFGARWEVLNQTAAVDLFGGDTVTEAIERMVAKTVQGSALVKAAAVKRDSVVEMLLQGLRAEPGESVAAVVNAVTRMHESALPAQRVEQVQAVAGRMTRDWAVSA